MVSTCLMSMRQIYWFLYQKERNRKQKEKRKDDVEINNDMYFLFRYK